MYVPKRALPFTRGIESLPSLSGHVMLFAHVSEAMFLNRYGLIVV
jgi:hypothetical protein